MFDWNVLMSLIDYYRLSSTSTATYIAPLGDLRNLQTYLFLLISLILGWGRACLSPL
jgi:hypothetical protein